MSESHGICPPMAWENIEWRVDSDPYERGNGHRCRWVAYIDARHAAQALDEWVGPTNWADSYSPGSSEHELWCTIAVRDTNGEWVAKTDIGSHKQIDETNQYYPDLNAQKALVSDAFKRAAVKWGVARNVYAMPTVYAVCKVDRRGKAIRHADTSKDIIRSLREHGVEVEHTMVAGGEEPEGTIVGAGQSQSQPEPEAPKQEKKEQAPPAQPSTDGKIRVAQAKQRLLEACDGDKAKAGRLWMDAGWDGLHGNAAVDESELAEVMEMAPIVGDETEPFEPQAVET